MATPRQPGPSSYHFDGVIVDLENFSVKKGDQAESLTPRAFDVLVYLIEHRGRVVEKQELFEQVWKETFVTDNALTKAIKDIRRAIGDDADAPRYIETVPKRGYRFVAKISQAEEAESATPEAEARHAEQVLIGQVEPRSDAAAETIVVPPKVSGAKAGPRLSRSTLLVAALASIVVGLTAFILWRTQTKPAPTETTGSLRTEQITTWPGLDIYPALSPDGNSVAYCSDHGGNFEIYVKPLTAGAREIQVTTDGQQNFEPSWSPDGKFIAYYSMNLHGICVVPASGGHARQLTEFGSRPAWSPDGSQIAFDSYPLIDLSATSVGALPPSTLWVVSPRGGDPLPVTQVGTPPGGHGSASWSPDGKRIVFLAYTGNNVEVWTVSAKGGDLRQLLHGRNWAYDPIYSPDGEHIYYGGVSELGNFVLYMLRVSPATNEAIGDPVEMANTGLARIKQLTISADGKRIAYSAPTMTGSIETVPISPASGYATSTPVSLTQSTSYRKGLPTFSPDGRRIAFTEFRGGVNQDIWVIDADGKNAIQVTIDPAIDWSSSWFPDNDRLAFQSNRQGKQMIWSVSISNGREKLLVDPGQDLGWPRVSPDGQQIAFNSTKSGSINIWIVPVEGGAPMQLTFDSEAMGWPCWSPDGKLLAFQAKRGDDTHVLVMPSSGGTATQLTFDHGQSWPHSWSSDGDKIAFAGFRNGYWNVWWVSRATKAQKQVTSYAKLNAFVRYPGWSPSGNQIVYEYAETTGNIWLMELK